MIGVIILCIFNYYMLGNSNLILRIKLLLSILKNKNFFYKRYSYLCTDFCNNDKKNGQIMPVSEI